MRKHLLMLTLLSVILLKVSAQADLHSNKLNEVIFNGHTIRLYKTDSGYLYDIFSQSKLIIHQDTNPFTQSPNGLEKKEDALKVAKWQIIHLDPLHPQVINSKTILPKEVAHQLNIELN